MTAWTGRLAPSLLQLSDFANISDELDTFTVDYWPGHESAMSLPSGGALTSNAPVTLGGAAKSGRFAKSYLQDYYYRVHIVDGVINLGGVTSQQSRDVEVWNAWFVEKLLSSITATGDDGLTLTEPEPAPTTFSPLESRIYQLSVAQVGSASVDASYIFAFPGESPDLLVTGTRVIVLPFKARLDSSVIERLEWLTDVLESFDGSEQRASLRNMPRRTFVFNFLEEGDNQRLLDSLLFSWQARIYALPIWMDTGLLTATSAAGTDVLYLSTDYLDYHVDGLVFLTDEAGTSETGTILSITSAAITLNDPLDNTWPAGTRIYPALTARIQPVQSITRKLTRLSSGQFTASVIDNWLPDAVESADIYRDFPLLTTQPKAYEDITDDYNRTLQVLDNQTGIRFYDDMSEFSSSIRDFLWLIQGRSEIWSFRQWLHARRGRAVPIWIPTWREDVRLVNNANSSDDSIAVAYLGYVDNLAQAINRRDLRIELTTGTIIYRRITSSSGAGTTETLGLDAALGITFTVAQVKTISFIEICRLNADAIEIEWLMGDLVKCRHKVKSLNYDV